MYGGCVFMDFEKSLVEAKGYGRYERINPALLPNLYIAYDPNRAEVSGTYHKKLRVLFEEKKPDIVAAMSEFADIAQQGRDALLAGRKEALPALVNANFDLRDRIFFAMANKRYAVLEMEKEEDSLESIFLELTDTEKRSVADTENDRDGAYELIDDKEEWN
jgi:galactokinase/mevalonate kinase-like predicted kinase